jgi:hypothetical protein
MALQAILTESWVPGSALQLAAYAFNLKLTHVLWCNNVYEEKELVHKLTP